VAIKVMLAEDHAIVREGIRVLIERESDMEVVCEAENGLEAVQKAHELRPDVVIMDVTMPEINGIEATRQIKAATSDIKILALSVHDKREYVMGMIRAGVSGYLLKDCVSAELVGAIRRVVANESYLSPKIAAIVIEEHKEKPLSSRSGEIVLKDSEIEIVRLLVEGNTAGEVAKLLNVTVKSIEAKRRRILEKLNFDSFAELVKYAIRKGLTTY